MLKNDLAARNAATVGTMCGLSYLAVYIARNLLSAVSPQLQEAGIFTTEQLGALSSAFFIIYALGQLINGFIGDKIKARHMISVGLVCAGICNFLFALSSGHWIVALLSYGLSGYFLSMIYGPMTKVIAENVDPRYAPRCSLGYTFASFLGTPVAGLLAVLMVWQGSFIACCGSLLLMGAVCYTVFLVCEKKGIVRYGEFQAKKEQNRSGIKVLLEYQIIKFILISIITGVIRTTVVFWMPTYLTQYLGFLPNQSSIIYTVSSLIMSVTAFISVFIYERLHHNMNLTLLVGFCGSAVFFLLLFFVKVPALNLVFLVLAIMANDCASTMIYSRYCPGLRDTGYVSSVTGFLDFISYAAASLASTLFANAVSDIGWGSLILVWFGLMALGVVICLPRKSRT